MKHLFFLNVNKKTVVCIQINLQLAVSQKISLLLNQKNTRERLTIEMIQRNPLIKISQKKNEDKLNSQ